MRRLALSIIAATALAAAFSGPAAAEPPVGSWVGVSGAVSIYSGDLAWIDGRGRATLVSRCGVRGHDWEFAPTAVAAGALAAIAPNDVRAALAASVPAETILDGVSARCGHRQTSYYAVDGNVVVGVEDGAAPTLLRRSIPGVR